jgi:hypothetical protein
LKTASSFWLGGDVWYRESDLFLSYDQTFTFEERVKDIVSWYKRFDIDFGTLFFNELYQTGNTFGPAGGGGFSEDTAIGDTNQTTTGR